MIDPELSEKLLAHIPKGMTKLAYLIGILQDSLLLYTLKAAAAPIPAELLADFTNTPLTAVEDVLKRLPQVEMAGDRYQLVQAEGLDDPDKLREAHEAIANNLAEELGL